jgi:Tfp pilus assembly protein PilZ
MLYMYALCNVCVVLFTIKQHEQLYVPGHVMWIRQSTTNNSNTNNNSDAALNISVQPNAQKDIVTLLLGPTCISDHSSGEYEQALQRLNTVITEQDQKSIE